MYRNDTCTQLQISARVVTFPSLGVKRAEDLPDPYKCCSEFDKVKASWKKKRLDDLLGPSDGISGDEEEEGEEGICQCWRNI